MKKISEIIQAIEARAPSGTAEDWDNVGLLSGDPAWRTSGAVVSIDLTEESIRVAKARKVRLIVNHHPCIFPKNRGISRVVQGNLVFDAIREGIAVAAYHTNFDRCALEVVDAIANGLGATPKGRLLDHPSGSLVKLVVFVPSTHSDSVRSAICEAGAGHVGNYDFCTFGTLGEGTFRGNESTNPFIGRPGKLEKAQEVRMETVFPRGLEKDVLKALFRAHPYEEVAYDLYPVEQAPASAGLVRGLGYGFWGEFPSPKTFSEVAKGVTSLFKVNGFLLTAQDGQSRRPTASVGSRVGRIRRIGFAAGKGADFVNAAASAGCDLFITGEAGYHSALGASRRGMAIMELGHRESELFFLMTMKDWLKEMGLRTQILNTPTQEIFSNSGLASKART